MILNNYARFINDVICVSLIAAKGGFGIVFVTLSLNIALLAYLYQQTTLSAFLHLKGVITRHKKFSLIMFLSQILCNTLSVPMLVKNTIPLLCVCSM